MELKGGAIDQDEPNEELGRTGRDMESVTKQSFDYDALTRADTSCLRTRMASTT